MKWRDSGAHREAAVTVKYEEPGAIGWGVRCHCRAFERVNYVSIFTFEKANSGYDMENRNAVVNLALTSPWSEFRNLGFLLHASV